MAKISLQIPTAAATSSQVRAHQFVSSGAQGVTVAAGPHGGTQVTTTFDVSSSSTLCSTTGGVRSCHLAVSNVPFGNDDVTVTLYLQAPVNGVIPSGSPILGVSTTSNVTLVCCTTVPTVTVYVMPTIANVTTSLPGVYTLFADGLAHQVSWLFNPVDYANNPITAGQNDPFSNPITVTMTETGGTGHTQLLFNGSPAAGNTATLTQSSQTIGVAYDGGGAPGYYATFSATATGVSPQTVKVVPMYVSSGSPYYSNGALTFTGSGETAAITISEAVGLNSYTLVPSAVTGCPSVVTLGTAVPASTSATATITANNVAVASSVGCQFSINDSFGTASRNISYSNTVTGGGVTIGGIAEYHTPIATPANIVTGADGLLYVTGPNGASPSTVWTYTTAGVEGNWSSGLAVTPLASAMGPDGNLWFVGGDANVYTWSDAANLNAAFSHPVVGASAFSAITQGPDGNMWVVDPGPMVIYAISPTTHSQLATSYVVAGTPGGITANSSSGAIWFYTNVSGNYELGSFFPGANPSYTAAIPGTGGVISGITTDSGGNVWVTDSVNNALDEYIAGAWHQHATGVSGAPAAVTMGADGNVYFSEPGTNQIGMFNVTTTSFTHFNIPTAGANPGGITLGPDGRIWFTERAVTQIGALTP